MFRIERTAFNKIVLDAASDHLEPLETERIVEWLNTNPTRVRVGSFNEAPYCPARQAGVYTYTRPRKPGEFLADEIMKFAQDFDTRIDDLAIEQGHIWNDGLPSHEIEVYDAD